MNLIKLVLSLIMLLGPCYANAQDYLLNCVALSHDLVFYKDGHFLAQDFLEQAYKLDSSNSSTSSNEITLNKKIVGAFVGPIFGYPKYNYGVVVAILDSINNYRVDTVFSIDAHLADVVMENRVEGRSPEEDYRIRFWRSKCEW